MQNSNQSTASGPKRVPPLAAIQAFLAVARLGSFARAGEALHLSQSSVSRQVALLEAHFRCTLFIRDTRHVALSDMGRRLLPYAEQIMDTLLQAQRAISQPESVTLRAHPTLTMRWLLPRLPDFYARHPDVRVNLDTAWQRFPDFRADGIDAMIEYGSGPWPALTAMRLWQEHLVPVCKPGYASRLAGHDALHGLVLLHAQPDDADWRRWAVQTGMSLDATGHRIFDTEDLALAAARHGQGIALADLVFVEDEVQSGELIILHDQVLASGKGYYLIWPAATDASPSFAGLREWLSDQATRIQARLDVVTGGSSVG